MVDVLAAVRSVSHPEPLWLQSERFSLSLSASGKAHRIGIVTDDSIQNKKKKHLNEGFCHAVSFHLVSGLKLKKGPKSQI